VCAKLAEAREERTGIGDEVRKEIENGTNYVPKQGGVGKQKKKRLGLRKRGLDDFRKGTCSSDHEGVPVNSERKQQNNWRD